MAVVSTLAISGYATINTFNTEIKLNSLEEKRTDIELCKTSIKYAHAFKDTMDKDNVDQVALSYYKKDVVENCGTISAAKAS